MAPSIHTYTDREAAEALRQNPGMVQSSEDPLEATQETVEYMCQLIKDSLADGIVQRACEGACRKARSDSAIACAVWVFAKHTIRFVHHSNLQAAWMPDPTALQLLIRPDALLKMARPKGDCAVFTTLICAMLDCAGVDWEIVTAAVNPRQPGIFSHVYPRAILSDGRRLVLDASHGKYPGWEVPAEHMSAKQVWNSAGQPIEDAEMGQFQGLHGYGAYLYGGADRRGLGQDDGSDGGDDGDSGGDQPIVTVDSPPIVVQPDTTSADYGAGYAQAYQDALDAGASATQASAIAAATNPPVAGGGSSLPALTSSGGSSSGSSGSNALAQDLAALLAGGTSLTKAITGQPTTTTTVNSSMLIFGGIAVVGLLLIMMMGKDK